MVVGSGGCGIVCRRDGDGEIVIEVADEGGERDAPVIEAFFQLCGFRGWVDGDAVIIRINGFDEFVVEFPPEDVDAFAFRVKTGTLGYDSFSEMQVYQPRRGELGLFLGEGGVEGALVVVIAVLDRVVFAADVDDGMAAREQSRIPSAEESAGGVGGEEAKHVNCQGFIGMEMAIVCSDQGWRGLHTLRRW